MSSGAPESPVPSTPGSVPATPGSVPSTPGPVPATAGPVPATAGPGSADPHAAGVLPTDEAQLALIESMRAAGMGALADGMGIELLEVGAERTVARMPVEGNTQPYGLLHGGASAVLAESVGSIASALHAAPDRIALGLELNCTHHKAMRDGYVIGTATPLVRGRSVASYAISITDEDGTPVCTARLTCLLRER